MTDNFIDFDEEIIDGVAREKVLIIDGHNLAFKTVFSAISHDPNDNGPFRLWMTYMFNNLFSLVKTHEPDKIIWAFDQKGSWRYSIYPEYKGHRKAQRSKSKLKHKEFYEAMDRFMVSVENAFSNMYVISLKGAEADDTIAVLSKYAFKYDEVIIVSNDGDMHQLISQNVNQYDMSSQKMVECLNPKRELELKILTGDSSDNIKGVRKGVGIKTAEKILDMGLEEFMDSLELGNLEKKVVHENFERNTKLIDFEYIPAEVKNEIMRIYDNYDIKDVEFKIVFKMFVRNKLPKMIDDWNSVSSLIKKLK